MLRAATQGRSIWEIELDDCAGCVAPPPMAPRDVHAALAMPSISYVHDARAARDVASERTTERALERAARFYVRTSLTYLARSANETQRIETISALYPHLIGESEVEGDEDEDAEM